MTDAGTMIRMENITKVFYTDEVETHALSGIHMEIRKGEYVSIAGPSGSGKSTLLALIGLLDSPSEGSYILNLQPVASLNISRAIAHSQSRDRIHLPEFQSDWRPECLRERRITPHLSRHALGRAQNASAAGA